MKKIKFIIPIFIVLGIFIVLYWISPNPIDKLNLNEVESIAVYSVDGEKVIDYLTDNEAKDLITIINSAKFSNLGTNEYRNYSGGRQQMFCIEMHDATKINLGATNYLIINEKGYKCDDDTLNYMYQLYFKYEEEHYPVTYK